jgi:hypothetical protein
MAHIGPTEEYIECLHSLAAPAQVLAKHGFIFEQLDENDLLGKRKCSGCGKGEYRSGVKNVMLTSDSHVKAKLQATAAIEREWVICRSVGVAVGR